jgi:hypothetical protein
MTPEANWNDRGCLRSRKSRRSPGMLGKRRQAPERTRIVRAGRAELSAFMRPASRDTRQLSRCWFAIRSLQSP